MVKTMTKSGAPMGRTTTARGDDDVLELSSVGVGELRSGCLGLRNWLLQAMTQNGGAGGEVRVMFSTAVKTPSLGTAPPG